MHNVFILGVLMGMRHALEADHIAAVATLSTAQTSPKSIVMIGTVWGLGHTLSLLLLAGFTLLLAQTIPQQMAQLLELAVAVMLIFLGMDALLKRTQKIQHPPLLRGRAFLVGIMHGMAGSAALILLAVNQIPSFLGGIIYIVFFGLGSMLGMAALAMLMSMPIGYSQRKYKLINHYLIFATAIFSMLVGVMLMIDNISTLL